jgi:hypothetical protein
MPEFAPIKDVVEVIGKADARRLHLGPITIIYLIKRPHPGIAAGVH